MIFIIIKLIKMKKLFLTASMILMVFALSSCSKKEDVKPNAKFLGTYKVQDVWGSSKEFIGSGRLEYELTIKPNGDSAVFIDNINKTLMNVKANVKGDSLIIESQTAKSSSGTTYDVDPEIGVLTAGKDLHIEFIYHDLDRGNLIGVIAVTMDGLKDSVVTKQN